MATNLPVLALGDSDKVRVGDVVLAIGNPMGIGQTVTMGIIGAKGRQTGLSSGSFEDFLQTDAAINQGNSGGALVSTNSELIGINSQILSPSGGSIGIGFAIPSNMARTITETLVKTGTGPPRPAWNYRSEIEYRPGKGTWNRGDQRSGCGPGTAEWGGCPSGTQAGRRHYKL